jgi:hypothetical protein
MRIRGCLYTVHKQHHRKSTAKLTDVHDHGHALFPPPCDDRVRENDGHHMYDHHVHVHHYRCQWQNYWVIITNGEQNTGFSKSETATITRPLSVRRWNKNQPTNQPKNKTSTQIDTYCPCPCPWWLPPSSLPCSDLSCPWSEVHYVVPNDG